MMPRQGVQASNSNLGVVHHELLNPNAIIFILYLYYFAAIVSVIILYFSASVLKFF
jgi:hypothetical protein